MKTKKIFHILTTLVMLPYINIGAIEMSNQDRELTALLNETKFLDVPGQTEEKRNIYQAEMNRLIDELLALPESNRTKKEVLGHMKNSLYRSSVADSEDREAFAIYMEKILDVFGIMSSEGLLNTWMYGFDPVKLKEELDNKSTN